jgi:hypothetical protein
LTKRFSTLLSELDLWMPKKKDTLGIPREKMPQIDSEDHKSFKKFLDKRNIGVRMIEINPKSLRATQGEFDSKKIESGLKKTEIRPIIVSQDGFVIDGHHRWLQAINGNKNTMKAIEIGTDARKALKLANKFPKSFKKGLYESVDYATNV